MRVLFLLIILLTVAAISATAQTLTHGTISLFSTNEGVKNLLDPETIAVDSWRGEFYIASATQARITAVSAHSRSPVATHVHFGTNPVRLLAADALHRRLLMTPRGAYPREGTLLAYDLLARRVAHTVALGPCERLQAIPDMQRSVLYVTTGREHILVLDLQSLAIQDSIAFNADCGGLAFDSAHSELYAAQAEPFQGLSRIKKFSTLNRELLRAIQFPASEPIDRLECDPLSGNVIAFSAGAAYAFDAFGQAVFEYAINDGVAATAASGLFRRTYVCNVRGAWESGKPGSKGRMHILGFEGIDIDSLEFDYPLVAVAVHEPSLTLAVLSPQDNILYLLNLPDYRPLKNVALGLHVESATALNTPAPLAARIAVTNSTKPLGGFTSYDLSQKRYEAFPTGFLPVDAAPLNATRGYAVLSQGEGTMFVHDSLGGITGSIAASGFLGTSERKAMIVSSNDGRDHVLAAFPEFGTYALFDAAGNALLATDFIAGFPGIHGSGKGLIQPCFVPGGKEFCLLALEDALLHVYNRTTFAFKTSIDLSGLDWDAMAPFARFVLQAGRDSGAVIVGSYRVPTSGLDAPSAMDEPGVLILAFPDGELVAGLARSDTALHFFLKRADGQVLETLPLPGNPSEAFASHDARMFLFCFEDDARVMYVAVQDVSALAPPPADTDLRLTLYPNPAPLAGTISVAIEVAGMHPDGFHLTVSDLAGRVTGRIAVQPAPWGAVLPLRELVQTPGMYLIRAEYGNFSAETLLWVTR